MEINKEIIWILMANIHSVMSFGKGSLGALLTGMTDRQGLMLSWEQPPGGSMLPPPADRLISIPAALTPVPQGSPVLAINFSPGLGFG